MKRILLLLLAAVVALGSVGCGNTKDRNIHSSRDKPKAADGD